MRTVSKFAYLIIAVFLIASADLSFCALVDTVVAIVNDDVITQSEIDFMIAPAYEKLAGQYQGKELQDMLNQARMEALQDIIETKLIIQQAKKQDIAVDEANVEERIKEVRSRFGSDEEFNEALQLQGITIDDLKKKYREQIMAAILVSREVRSRIFVTPSEVAAYYNGHKDQFNVPESVEIWNILVKVGENEDGNEAKDKAARIWRMIKAGADFSSLAKKYSQGPFAEEGGYMGFVKKKQLMPELDKIVFKLNEGEVSNVIESKLGYHIFKAGKVAPAGTLKIDEVRQNIETAIYTSKAEIKYLEWIKKLKEGAYIDVKVK